MIPGPVLVAIGLLIFVFMLAYAITRLIRVVAPNEALIISGRGKVIPVNGGSAMVLPIVQKAGKLNTSLRTLDVPAIDVMTRDKVPINIDALVQCKIGTQPEELLSAAERFLGKSEEQVDDMIKDALVAFLRTIVSTMDAIPLYQDQASFVEKVTELAKKDLGAQGVVIDNFLISKIHDQNEYFISLGREEIAQKKQAADIAVAKASQATREAVAQAEQAAKKAEIESLQNQAEFEKDKDLKIAEFKQATETANADAEMAREIRTADLKKNLAVNEGAAEVARQQQQVLVQEQAILVADKREEAETVIPAKRRAEAAVLEAKGASDAMAASAEGEATRKTKIADAEAAATRATRTANADGIRAEGEAEGAAKKAQLLGEAEGERQLAEARAGENEVNFRLEVVKEVVKGYTEVGKAAAAGMGEFGKNAKFTEISSGGNGSGGGLVNAAGRLPEMLTRANGAAQSLFGVDLGQMIGGFMNDVRGKTNGNGAHANGESPATEAEPVAVAASSDSDESEPTA